MKKGLLFFVAFIFNQLQGQTLTQVSYEPKPGDAQTTLVLDTTLFTNGLPLSQTGAGINWDFTKIKANSLAFTTNYDQVSSSSFSVDFPTATVVQKEGPNFHVFLRSANTPTTQTEVLGIRTTSLSTTFTDVAIAAKFPISLGSTHSDNMSGTFSMTTFSGNCSGKITVKADASGTLTLPDGFVYSQVLRVKSTQTLTASQGLISGTLKQTTYDFYDMTEKFPILSISYSSISFAIGSPTITAGVSGNAKSFLVGINEIGPAGKFTLYPSPANDILTLDCDNCLSEGITYEIVDAMGRVVLSPKVLKETSITVDVSMLETGMYTVVLKANGRQSTRKLIIQ